MKIYNYENYIPNNSLEIVFDYQFEHKGISFSVNS